MLLPIEWLPADQPAPQLLVLLHGAAGDAQTMLPLAAALRESFPQAAILAPDAPQGDAQGRHWFDPRALDDPACFDAATAALPALVAWLQSTQQRLRVGPAATALAGFSQGATLALALACRHDGLAGRVIAFGGRFPRLPAAAPRATTLHLLHGGADPVVDPALARQALRHLGVLHADATLDLAQGVGHELHPALIDSALFRLRNHIPHRTWRAALGGALPDTA